MTQKPPESKLMPMVPIKVIGSLKLILTEMTDPTPYEPLAVEDVIDVMIGAVVSIIILEPVAIFVTGNVVTKLFKATSRAVMFTTTLVAVKSAEEWPANTVYVPVAVVPVKPLITQMPPESKLMPIVPVKVITSLKLIRMVMTSPAL